MVIPMLHPSASSGEPVVLDPSRPLLKDLEISLTDRCNVSSSSHHPDEVLSPDFEYLQRKNLLGFDEIARLVGIFSSLGTRRIRLTGGEPLLRRHIPDLIGMLRHLNPEVEIVLMTDGSLLSHFARDLRKAGLHRIVVTLDAVDDAGVPVRQVLDGITAAVAAGFSPVKINRVIRRGVNEEAIGRLTERFSGPDHVVRFIEHTDAGDNGWRIQDVVPAREIAARLETDDSLSPLLPREAGEVVRRFRTARGGEIGIIAGATQPSAGDHHRAWLSSDGKLQTNLFVPYSADLLGLLRAGGSDHELAEIIRATWEQDAISDEPLASAS